jgi:uridine kinase
VLLTASSPGWYLWAMPMLVLFQARASKSDLLVMGVFGALYVAVGFLRSHQPRVFDTDIAGAAADRISSLLGSHGLALLQTAVIGLGAVLLLTIWRQAVAQNDYFRVSRKRIVIGVAGDSGSGKDTLISSLVPLFGEHSVVTISGDDYHLWDRHRPMWQVMTHLNPRANDLDRFGRDVLALADGQTIYSHHYDHETGKSTKPLRVASRDVVIVGGLHALWLPLLRERYDLGIYLDIDEGLRRAFKVDRDVRTRGHDVERVVDALAKREPDAVKFIRPQARHADLVLALRPMNLEATAMGLPLRFKLLVRAQHGLQEEALVRTLVGLCGLHVDVDLDGDDSTMSLTIEGDSTADDMVAAARELLPGLHELLDAEPKWCDGILGVMQLVVMAHVHQALRRRLR